MEIHFHVDSYAPSSKGRLPIYTPLFRAPGTLPQNANTYTIDRW